VRTSSIVVLIARSANPFCEEEYGAENSCVIPCVWVYSLHVPVSNAPSVHRHQIFLPVVVSDLVRKTSKAAKVVVSSLSERYAPNLYEVPPSTIIIRYTFPPMDCT
jgi:hypothetical protein